MRLRRYIKCITQTLEQAIHFLKQKSRAFHFFEEFWSNFPLFGHMVKLPIGQGFTEFPTLFGFYRKREKLKKDSEVNPDMCFLSM